MDGWIKAHRKMCENWIWQDEEPFDKRSAWLDMLLMTNYADNKILFNGEIITIKKGQFITSVRKLSAKWKWSTNKTYRFLKLLIDDGMIIKHSNNDRTLITIVNYENYQEQEYSSENTDETVTKHNKEIKKEKNTISNNLDEDKLKKDFEIIYQRYPKKVGKTEGYKRYKAWVTNGRRVNGHCIKLTNKQIWSAMIKYIKEMEDANKSLEYYKQFDTFIGNSILDYVEDEKK